MDYLKRGLTNNIITLKYVRYLATNFLDINLVRKIPSFWHYEAHVLNKCLDLSPANFGGDYKMKRVHGAILI